MNQFLAKPNREETIMSHTEKLLIEYERLGKLYPQLRQNQLLWDMLKLVCVYHDFGKINHGFQKRMNMIIKERIESNSQSENRPKKNSKGKNLLTGEFHHAVLSMACLDSHILKDYFFREYLRSVNKEMAELSPEEKKKAKYYYKNFSEEIYKAILFHHHRKNLLNYKISDIAQALQNMTADFIKMLDYISNHAQIYPNLSQAIQYFSIDSCKEPIFQDVYYQSYMNDILDDKKFDEAIKYIFLKGLLNRIDYAASAGIEVEHPNDFLEVGLDSFMKNLNLQKQKNQEELTDWNSLQKYAKKHQDQNIIALAQTGMGKTEAALWWIGNHKGFFTLPLRTAINSIYDRIKNKIIKNNKIDTRVGLLHSDSFEYYLNMDDNSKEEEANLLDIDEYYLRTKQLSLPLTITTLDQLFIFVFRYVGYEEKLATMSYSKVVIDEIQMYGSDLTAFLIVGLSMIQKMGGKFAIFTATFPSFISNLLSEQRVNFYPELSKINTKSLPRFIDNKIRHRMQLLKDEINSNFIIDIFEKNKDKKLLVICNTVKQCQKIYSELKEKLSLTDEALKNTDVLNRKINLFHSKFIRKDRNQLEKKIFQFSDDETINRSGIWITTSIAEASLDIDLDLLITELSDINSLFQRMGRCYRKRCWDTDKPNCYVFDGGNVYCSGVGTVISTEIFCMSKDALRDLFADKEQMDITEEMKMDLVNDIYSMKNIIEKAPIYLKEIKDYLEKPKYFFSNEMNKKEAYKNFRNIYSETVIPVEVYKIHQIDIDKCISQIQDRNCLYKEKVLLRQDILQYSLSLEKTYLNKKHPILKELKLGNNQVIRVVDYKYDSLLGLINESITKKVEKH